jgi:hypothetical protein
MNEQYDPEEYGPLMSRLRRYGPAGCERVYQTLPRRE